MGVILGRVDGEEVVSGSLSSFFTYVLVDFNAIDVGRCELVADNEVTEQS